MNSLPKYVVSSSLEQPHWNNAKALNGDLVEQVSKLKRDIDGEILVYASAELVRGLLDHDLVDELRLVVFPVVIGAGQRLFNETNSTKPMHLIGTQPIGEGLVLLTYRLAFRDATAD